MITTEEIISLSRIHAKGTGDPAVGREDVAQQIATELVRRPADHFGHGWVRAKSIRRDLSMSKQCRRRRDCEAIGDYQVTINSHECGIEEKEQLELIRQVELSPLQKVVIEEMLNGFTPTEIALGYNLSAVSVQAALRIAINRIREEFGFQPLDQIRLGRDRTADLKNLPKPPPRICCVCGVDISHRQISAKFCGDDCRQVHRMHKEKMSTRAGST